MAYEKEFARIAEIGDPVRKRSMFMGFLSREMLARDAKAPVIVGGHAVEVFTRGGYTTADIDVKGNRDTMEAILADMGFRFEETHYVNRELDIYIQWLGQGPNPVTENPDKLVEVDLGEGLFMQLVGFEDLVVDRLLAYEFWKDSDSLMWAARVLEAAMTGGTELDMDYLRERAENEEVSEALDEALKKARTDP